MSDAPGNGHLRRIEVATIAHDFNNLLTAITAATDAALARPIADAETRAALAQIRISAQRGAGLVRRLLDNDDPGADLRASAIDLVIEGLVATLHDLAGPRVRLEVALGLGDRRVMLDPDDLLHTLLNLTANARDAMPEGGTLHLRTYPVLLREPLPAVPEPVPPGHYAVTDFGDDGSGIPPALLGQVFEPGFTTKPHSRGGGLGLYSVRQMVRRHGGFVALESRPGAGTTVKLYLPVLDLLSQRGHGRLVLLAEDEPPVRRLAARALTAQGWEVIAAADADAVLRLLPCAGTAARRPAVLITDIALPGCDGPALVRAIRQRWPGLPALLISGYADTAISSGLEPVGFLRKPFALADLMDAVARVAGIGVHNRTQC
ncbi:MAG TPA: ATP-binding protein [Acetobacteraceae bacterium]|nr:ATP-binding protein [Acetobacteraceae bacterium]